ncbi:MAG: adenylate/guanylate cyclase domain-containing protein [Bacteroidetes bacterium]|nr:adenylate/guanylate cyclase domain-containing protein [Bacteroidota bacterium]
MSAFLFGYTLVWLVPSLFETWNLQAVDKLFLLRYRYFPERYPYNHHIVHVDETDSTVQVLGGSYLTREHYARVVKNLGTMQTAAQAWDYIFRAPSSPEEDTHFLQANREAKNTYYGLAFGLRKRQLKNEAPRPRAHREYLQTTKWYINVEGDTSELYVGVNPIITFPELAHSARGLGFLSLHIDQDGVFRRAPLLVRYEDGFYPSLPFRVVCDYLHVQPSDILLKPGKYVILRNARKPNEPPRDIVIPVDKHCNLLINFVGPWEAMTHYNMAAIYHASDDQDALEYDWTPLLKGKIVIVSVAATGAADVAPVPTDNEYPLSGVHANVIHTILTENFLIVPSAFAMVGIEVFLLCTIGFFALRFSSRGLWLGALCLIVVYVSVVIVLFLVGNIILTIVRPVLIVSVSVFGVLAYRFIREEREKEALRHSLEAYLPPTLVRRMIVHPEVLFEVHKRELTILFSDIKSFSTYSAPMDPDTIQQFLSEYFNAMVDIVFQYEGTVDKYIGDGLMVFFGAPEYQPDHAVRCVKAAIAMQKKCRELKGQWIERGLFPLQIRIGINTGTVVVGNFGTPKKLSYTVLGSDVNLANRLESNAPVEGIMISRRTYELVKDVIPALPHEPIKAKGFDTPVEVYIIPVDDIDVNL